MNWFQSQIRGLAGLSRRIVYGAQYHCRIEAIVFSSNISRKLLDIIVALQQCDDFCDGRRVDPVYGPAATRMVERPRVLMVGFVRYDDPGHCWDRN